MSKPLNTATKRFIFSQGISLFGSMLVQYAIMWHLTLTTKSGTVMMLSILAGFIPSLLLSPFAGVWADRYDRKFLIRTADGLIALVTLILAVLFRLGYQSIGLFLFISAVRSLGSAIHGPSVNALIPDLVDEDQLMKVQGIQSSLQSGIMIISPLLSAALMANYPLELIFSLDVITAIIAIVLLQFVEVQRKQAHTEPGKPFEELKEGYRYMRSHKFLIPFFFFAGAVNFLIAPVAFLNTLQTVFKFGDEAWRLSYVEVAFALGMMAGGWVISRYEGFKNRVLTMVASMMVMGLLSVGLALSSTFPLYLGVMTVFGLILPYYNAPATVLIQEKVEPQYLGRVFSVFMMISSSIMPLSMLIFGPLADAWDVNAIVFYSGWVMLIFGLLLLTRKKWLNLGQ